MIEIPGVDVRRLVAVLGLKLVELDLDRLEQEFEVLSDSVGLEDPLELLERLKSQGHLDEAAIITVAGDQWFSDQAYTASLHVSKLDPETCGKDYIKFSRLLLLALEAERDDEFYALLEPLTAIAMPENTAGHFKATSRISPRRIVAARRRLESMEILRGEELKIPAALRFFVDFSADQAERQSVPVQLGLVAILAIRTIVGRKVGGAIK